MMDDSDSLEACPYNKSHVLYKSRMQTHLKKCAYANLHSQQNVDPLLMKVCSYNSNHHVPVAEWTEHMVTCPDKAPVHRFITSLSNGEQGSAIPYKQIQLPPTEENWDEDEECSTYNPEEHATTGVILRAAQGIPKSERKTFRLRERERINRIRENEEALTKVAPKPQPVTVVEKHAFTEQALRHPKECQLGMGRGRHLSTSSALSGDDDFAVQGIGRAYTLRGMSSGMQRLPAMRPKSINSLVSALTLTNASSSENTFSSNSRPTSANSGEDEDGFVQQRSRKNKKGKNTVGTPNTCSQPSSVSGQAPSSSNPLTTPGSSTTFSFPGLPGKGRGRIPKN